MKILLQQSLRLRLVLLPLILFCLGGFSPILAQNLAGPFDFSTASQLTANFATTCTSGATLTVSGGQLAQIGSNTAAWVYDTTPDSTPTNATFSSFCVTAQFTPQAANDSFGFYFYNGGNRTNGSMLVVYNADFSGSDDRIRFFSVACMNSNDPGTPYVGSQYLPTQTLSGGGYSVGKLCQATLVVTPMGSDGAIATMIISDLSGSSLPNFIATQYLAGLGATSGEIGFRANKTTTGTTTFDNITVRAPLAITVLENSTTSATISWPAYAGATYYKAYRNGVLQTSTTNLSYVDYGPMDWFKSYEYQVIAYDSNWRVVTVSPITVFAYRRFAFVPPWDDASTGTSADVSDWSTQSASQQVTVSNGHFSAGGQRIRFMGTNMTAQACFPSYNDPLLGNVAEKIAARMAKLGINCVRLISIDGTIPYGGLNTDKLTFNTTQLDRLDYFVSRLKAHGIYVDLVLHSSRYYPGYTSDSVPAIDIYHPGMLQLQKDYASALLTHTNPYTGNTYANEPAVALIEINNENGLIRHWRAGLFNTGTTINSAYLTELQTQWNTWLATKYANTASLSAAWATSSGQSYGTSLMTNGDFASGTGTGPYVNALVNGSRWYFQVQSTSTQSVTATSVLVNGGSPDGTKRALKVSVTQACPAAGWRSQLLYTPVDGTSVSPIQYTAKFWAKADAARTLSVCIQQNHPPYGSLGNTNVVLTTEWRRYTLVIPVTTTDSNAVFVVSNFAAQTGDIWFADCSLVTGNTLLGGRETWAEGSLGSEMLGNGTFSGSIYPWQLQYANPQLATVSIVQDSEVGSAAQIDITSTSTESYKVGLLQMNRTCTNGQPYTVTFQAKASVARPMDVGLGQGYGPNYYTYAYSSVNLTTAWQTYTVVLAPNMSAAGLSSDSQTQFSFGGLACTAGQVWIANVSLKQGVMSTGLPSGETLGTATMLQSTTLLQRSRAAQKDWLKFLWETEKNYWSTMKTYIKTTLGAKGLIIGTQTNFSPALVQADMDVVDVHSYWQHPSSVSDGENWNVRNISMAGDATGGAFGPAALTRVPGKPFVCTEYNTPSPITYGGETLLLAAAYAGMHDWDGLFIFGYEHGALASQQFFTTYFQIAQEPVKSYTLPISASMMRKGAVATTSNAVTASITPDQAIAMSARSSWPGAGDYGIPAKAALIYPTGIKSTTTYSQVVVPYIPTSTTELYSSTGELMWDTSDKLVTVNTAKAKVFVGKSNSQSFNFGDGVVVTPGASMQAGNWCAISLMAKDGANFAAAGKVLITATGYTDNHGMLWKTGMGPLDATSSIGTNWGKAPVLTEGIDATIVLPAAYDKVTVWTLDTRGQHLTQVPVTNASGYASFTLSRSNLTIWYEAVIAP